MNFTKLPRSPRVMKSLTGLTLEEFNELLPLFTNALTTLRTNRIDRIRAVGAGQKGKLPTMEHKLFFILLYYKVYPTYDVLGFLFDKSRGRSYDAVQELTQSLEQALGRACVLPKRKIRSAEEFFATFPSTKDVFIDGKERRIERPKNPKKQRNTYSGKKKAHTRKSIVMCDEDRHILFVSPAKPGRRHDKALTDKCGLATAIPPDVGVFADTAFIGMHHQNLVTPKRASKHHPLTEEEKADNKVISGLRIVVEHAIGGMSRFGIMAKQYRNKKPRFENQMIGNCAGLWNWHLRCAGL